MRILVTAGPTREPIDPVRFISNRSSGKMGYAVACHARDRGHDVLLVSGPVSIAVPENVRSIAVNTAAEMLAAVEENLEWCDALVMAAAVADWRPLTSSTSKMKKAGVALSLPLERTQDILQTVADRKGDRIFVGFAAETHSIVANAARRRRESLWPRCRRILSHGRNP